MKAPPWFVGSGPISRRKPHNGNAGYVAELKAKLGGHIVIYRAAEAGIDSNTKYVVMHEPSSNHIQEPTLAKARQTMKALAKAETLDDARHVADVFPRGSDDE